VFVYSSATSKYYLRPATSILSILRGQIRPSGHARPQKLAPIWPSITRERDCHHHVSQYWYLDRSDTGTTPAYHFGGRSRKDCTPTITPPTPVTCTVQSLGVWVPCPAQIIMNKIKRSAMHLFRITYPFYPPVLSPFVLRIHLVVNIFSLLTWIISEPHWEHIWNINGEERVINWNIYFKYILNKAPDFALFKLLIYSQ